jgi:hypothetical protein
MQLCLTISADRNALPSPPQQQQARRMLPPQNMHVGLREDFEG